MAYTHTISALVCQACDWRGSSINAAIGHELNRHDGAQTCWWDREIAGFYTHAGRTTVTELQAVDFDEDGR